MIEDFGDVHLLEQQLRYQTLHDLLTGLPNQEYFWIHLRAILERADPATTVTLCKIDLDGFAIVNDGHGHDAGNLVLQTVARRLDRLVSGEQAMVARFGADEFALLIQDSPRTPHTATLAADINSELSEPVFLGDHGLSVSAAVGIVRRRGRGIDAAELVRMADVTMHRAKRTGRGQWGLYDQHTDADERARYALANAMPGAWENGQITLTYQPLVRVDPTAGDTGRIVALQTLLSWEHPEHGVIGHEDCVGLAEQSGLVLSIGPWMLQEACKQVRGWRDQLGAIVPPVRVDLTTHLGQDPDLMAVLRGALNTAGLAPQDVQLGIPVELAIANQGDAQENLRALADAGAGTVFTRFGQGIGNLATLDGGPVQAVDITAQLVRMAQRPDSVLRDALTTLIPLIRRTGTRVVVAGVDTAEQADWWRRLGADSARGAAFGPPGTAEDMMGRLAQ
jgi:diguanylate cyclase (GGDEF)-like protein